MKGEGVELFFQEYLDGIHGKLASEIKVCIISLHNTPQGMCRTLPSLVTLKKINELNYLCTTVLKICDIVATQARNAVLLNVLTYGVACEVQGNLILIIQYLNGKINYLELDDTNHNINNLRYQLLGG